MYVDTTARQGLTTTAPGNTQGYGSPQHPCPSCGYCPCCGRYRPQPTVPFYPYQVPYMPSYTRVGDTNLPGQTWTSTGCVQ